MDEQNAQTKRIEQFMTQIKQRNRMTRRILISYIVVGLFMQVVYCILMDYELIVSERLLMTIGWGFMLGSTSMCYGIYFIFQYTFVENEDRKKMHSLMESFCLMPFSMEDYFKEIHKRLIKKEILFGFIVWLCYVAGMFIGEKSGKGSGFGIYVPEHPGRGIIISVAGTLYVLLCMTIGYAIMKGSFYIRYHNRMKGNATG